MSHEGVWPGGPVTDVGREADGVAGGGPDRSVRPGAAHEGTAGAAVQISRLVSHGCVGLCAIEIKTWADFPLFIYEHAFI